MPSATMASLNGFDRRGGRTAPAASSTPSGSSGDTTVSHLRLADGHLGLLHKAQRLGVEAAAPCPGRRRYTLARLIFILSLLDGRHRSAMRSERRRVEVVELVTAIPAGVHQARCLEQIEVLRDRLPRGRDLMPHDQPIADLEECLAIAIGQFVEDLASSGIGQGLEHIAHAHSIGK